MMTAKYFLLAVFPVTLTTAISYGVNCDIWVMSPYWDGNSFDTWSKKRVELMIRGGDEQVETWTSVTLLYNPRQRAGATFRPVADPSLSSTHHFVEMMTEVLHRIPLLTAVEAEEWGAGWQVRRWAHGSSWMNCLLSGIIPNLLKRECAIMT